MRESSRRLRFRAIAAVVAWLGVGLLAVKGYAEPSSAPATITSDELEMQDNGEKTIFLGHVVLTETPYLLKAHRMVRVKTTGLVTADGAIDGTWLSEKGEKVKAYGSEGFYDPAVPKTELWGKDARLVRWETVRDTAPVEIGADRFRALHHEKEFYALGHVVITQKPKVLTKSDEAKYDQKDQTIQLYGAVPISIHIADVKGTGDFIADKGRLTLNPKTAHLEGHVVGHVDPGKTL